MVAHAAVGKPQKRQDAPQKLTGQEQFTADLQLHGLLHARLVGSAYAHARINGVDKSAALAIPGVVAVLTAGDLPIAKDQHGDPVDKPLASDEATYAGQPIAIVLAETQAAAEDGANAVEIDAEPMDVLVDLTAAMAPDAIRVNAAGGVMNEEEAAMHNADAAGAADVDAEALPPNVSNTVNFTRGDVAAGFAEADKVVELTFRSNAVHQGYIEPQTALVAADAFGKLTIYTSTQGAFYCRQRVAGVLGLEMHDINVVPMPVGGGFGGKFVLIEPMVAAAAMAVKRPVLLQYHRIEDFLSANPAPGSEITVKLGAKADGTITAMQGNLLFATGSVPGSPLQIAAILLGGYYKFPNLEITGKEVLTNRPKSGAYRAPGAQQASHAIEGAMDELGRELGIDGLTLRLKNAAEAGDLRPNGGEWPRIGLKEILEALAEHPRWVNREESRKAGKGIGIAVGGWPGGVEPASATCRLDADGKLTIVLGSVDLNGTNTSFGMMAAEVFGMDADDVKVVTGSTDTAPWSGGTGGSKITYTVGPAVVKAAESARQQLLSIAAQHLEAALEDLEIVNGMVQVKGVPGSGVSLKEIAGKAGSGGYEPVFGSGASAITESAPGFAVHLAEVEVDELTGVTNVTAYVAVQDVGFAINPAAVEGQIHGGVAQGIGWALYEGMSYDDDGQLLNATFQDYAMPTFAMIPNMDVVMVEVPAQHGPFGAKGVGEPPAIPGAGAVANAVRDAIGVRITEIPLLPEVVLRGVWQANGNPQANGH